MNKKIITVAILILSIAIIAKGLFVALKSIKTDEFHKSAIIFVLDSSVSNQIQLDNEIKYLKSLCSILDPEDEIKIIRVAGESYLIFEGSASDSSGITKAVSKYAKYEKNTVQASYATAIKKAFSHCITMAREGYNPSIVVIGDLEDNYGYNEQINWEVLPKNIKNTKKYIPEFAMMFAYAHPKKLDMVKEKLTSVLGEKKLIIVNEQNIEKSQRRFLNAIGR